MGQIVGVKDKADKENQNLRAEITSLKKQISRLRKRLSRFSPDDGSEEEEGETHFIPPKQDKDDSCPTCAADIAVITTPSGAKLACCKAKCGYRKKV